jgi:hypothetical protein
MMREELLKVLPEVKEIENPDLREGTIQCFLLACQAGGKTPAVMQEMPFSALVSTKVSFADKVRCVYHICVQTAVTINQYMPGSITLNMDILKSGALLCDVAKLLELEKTPKGEWKKGKAGSLVRHPFSGVGLAMQAGLPEEVQHIIASHAGEGNLFPRTPEAIIVYHADFAVFDPFVEGKVLKESDSESA